MSCSFLWVGQRFHICIRIKTGQLSPGWLPTSLKKYMGNARHQFRMRTERYGPLDDQAGDLYIPDRPHPPVVCLLHGGFWRIPYGRDQMVAIAEDLAERGYAVWNLEYRRLGAPGFSWPAPFDDVIAGIEYLTQLQANTLDLRRLVVIGHSAGGQLALLSATLNRVGRSFIRANKIRIAAVAGQAPITDLVRSYQLGVGGSAIAELLGGEPPDLQPHYQDASPIAHLPLGIPQLILHGTVDDVVPLDLSRAYVQAARAAGDRVDLEALPGAGHMDFIDPSSAAHAALCRWLLRLF